MIKKLRRRFIITAMAVVLAVLLVIVTVMNAANFINSDNEANILLAFLSDNGGSFGRNPEEAQPPMKPENAELPAFPDGEGELLPGGDNRQFDPRRMFPNGAPNMFTVETPYETRYFTAVLRDNGEAVSVDISRIASVTGEDALALARKVLLSGRKSGYEESIKYRVNYEPDNNLCVFVDRSRALKSVTDFMWISLLVSFGSSAAIFVLLIIFSGLVIKPVAESYEKQKRFITDAGHELKTPLAVINSCTEVIELEQGESKWTRGITSQTERLARLTNDLVALSRMDEGAKLNIEEFSLSETVSEILDAFSIMAEQKGVAFTTDVASGIMYKGDKGLISKVCSIMADNAVKYTPEDGSVFFSLSRKGRSIRLVSENTADNIEKGAHPEFFDRFHRGDSSHNSDTPGYGIGLSMAQSVVTAHGGRIEASSKDGSSLTVTASLRC